MTPTSSSTAFAFLLCQFIFLQLSGLVSSYSVLTLTQGFQYHTLMAQICTSFPHAPPPQPCICSPPVSGVSPGPKLGPPHIVLYTTHSPCSSSEKGPSAPLLILFPVSKPLLLWGPLDMLVSEPLDLDLRPSLGRLL